MRDEEGTGAAPEEARRGSGTDIMAEAGYEWKVKRAGPRPRLLSRGVGRAFKKELGVKLGDRRRTGYGQPGKPGE